MTKEFLLNTLLPYKENKSLCAVYGTSCKYLTIGKKKCPIGLYMKTGEWQKYPNGVNLLFEKYPEKDIMTDEWLEQKVNIECAAQIQIYHDNLAFFYRNNIGSYLNICNGAIYQLESITGFNLNELKF